MSKTQHTPGPWKINDMSLPSNGFITIGPAKIIPKNKGKKYAIIQCDPETIANAELIASAPDLLRERDELKENNKINAETALRFSNRITEIESLNSELRIRWTKAESSISLLFTQNQDLQCLNSELLEALKRIRRHGLIENEDYDYVVNLMGEAIAKAEGGANG